MFHEVDFRKIVSLSNFIKDNAFIILEQTLSVKAVCIDRYALMELSDKLPDLEALRLSRRFSSSRIVQTRVTQPGCISFSVIRSSVVCG